MTPASVQVEFALGRQVAGAVNEPAGAAQVFFQRGTIGAQAGEYKAPVAVTTRDTRQTVVAFVEVRAIRPREGHTGQLAAQIIRPAVVGAGKRPGMTRVCRADQGAAVGAAVEKDRHLSRFVADHEHGLVADLAGHIVARLGHLAVVADKHPHPVEDFFEFLLKDVRVGVQRGVDLVVVNQGPNVDLGRSFKLGSVGRGLLHARSPSCARLGFRVSFDRELSILGGRSIYRRVQSGLTQIVD